MEQLVMELMKEVKALRREVERSRREHPNFVIIEGDPTMPARKGALRFDCIDGRWFYARDGSWIEIVP